MAGWSVWHKLSNPTGRNLTYAIQVKDQIGSYFYFPFLGMHKAAGAFGGIRIWSRPQIPVPFPSPRLRRLLENGHNLPFPDGLLINGRGWNGNTLTVDQGSYPNNL
ncbi:hypothetical protein JHK84_050004 [Glycine max]|nr:hypothetical protein JHK84_050004 [Glycine max]